MWNRFSFYFCGVWEKFGLCFLSRRWIIVWENRTVRLKYFGGRPVDGCRWYCHGHGDIPPIVISELNHISLAARPYLTWVRQQIRKWEAKTCIPADGSRDSAKILESKESRRISTRKFVMLWLWFIFHSPMLNFFPFPTILGIYSVLTGSDWNKIIGDLSNKFICFFSWSYLLILPVIMRDFH